MEQEELRILLLQVIESQARIEAKLDALTKQDAERLPSRGRSSTSPSTKRDLDKAARKQAILSGTMTRRK